MNHGWLCDKLVMTMVGDSDKQAGDGHAAPPGNASLMALAVGILGAALILLIVIDLLIVVWGRAFPAELNTLTSLIAGGLIGFLTPHVMASPPKYSPPPPPAGGVVSGLRRQAQGADGEAATAGDHDAATAAVGPEDPAE